MLKPPDPRKLLSTQHELPCQSVGCTVIVMPTVGELAQFAIACAWGILGYWWAWIPNDSNPKVPLFSALLAGFFGLKLTMFLYLWVRFGWKAARSMKMFF